MSQSGSILLYITEELPNPEAALMRVVEWLGANWVMCAERTVGESKGWELTQSYERDEIESPSPPSEVVCDRCGVAGIRGVFRTGSALTIDLNTSARTDAFCQNHAEIPEVLRGDFNPGSPIITLGWHDIIEELADERRLLARSFFTLRIWGYGTPRNDTAYRKAIGELAFVKEFEKGLSEIITGVRIQSAVLFSY